MKTWRRYQPVRKFSVITLRNAEVIYLGSWLNALICVQGEFNNWPASTRKSCTATWKTWIRHRDAWTTSCRSLKLQIPFHMIDQGVNWDTDLFEPFLSAHLNEIWSAQAASSGLHWLQIWLNCDVPLNFYWISLYIAAGYILNLAPNFRRCSANDVVGEPGRNRAPRPGQPVKIWMKFHLAMAISNWSNKNQPGKLRHHFRPIFHLAGPKLLIYLHLTRTSMYPDCWVSITDIYATVSRVYLEQSKLTKYTV